jgi:ATP-dependent helicase HepA
VPPDLEELTEDVVTAACERLGLSAEPHRDGRVWSVELGHRALVDGLPGVPGGSSYLGTFDRRVAVEDETIDFYASGHPLVEGLLAHLEDSALGRAGLLHVRSEVEEGFGLVAIYRGDGPDGGLDVVAVDLNGKARPEWAESISRRPLRTRRVRPEDWVRAPGWAVLIRSLARRLQRAGRPEAVLAVRIGG